MLESNLETYFNKSLSPEVRHFIATAIRKGTVAALVELNTTEPPLDREHRESVISTSLEILLERHGNGQPIGEAESIVKLAEIAKHRKRAEHFLRISQN